jgi:hypothetical protein
VNSQRAADRVSVTSFVKATLSITFGRGERLEMSGHPEYLIIKLTK